MRPRRRGAALPRRIPVRPRVIEIPAIAWKPILHGIILRTRPRKSAHAYNQVWTDEGSPLAVITRAPGGGACRAAFGDSGDGRLCDALRQSRRSPTAIAAHDERRLHPDPRRAALSAILRGDDGDGQRRGLRRARARCAGSRRCARCRLIMTIPPISSALARTSPRQLAALDFEPERAAAQLPRHAAADAGAWRSLSLPLPQDRAPAVRGARTRRSTSPSSRASAARNGWSRRPTRRWPAMPGKGVNEGRGRRARLLRRLPGDAGGARQFADASTFLAAGGKRFRLSRLPQRLAGEHDNAANPARRANLKDGQPADISVARTERRGSWHEWRSSPAERAASARRSASRSRTWASRSPPIMPAMRNGRSEFTERTGITAYKWDVADFDACQAGVTQVESRPRAGRRPRQQCRHHPRRAR